MRNGGYTGVGTRISSPGSDQGVDHLTHAGHHVGDDLHPTGIHGPGPGAPGTVDERPDHLVEQAVGRIAQLAATDPLVDHLGDERGGGQIHVRDPHRDHPRRIPRPLEGPPGREFLGGDAIEGIGHNSATVTSWPSFTRPATS